VVCQTAFPTNDSRQIVAAALQGLDSIYQPGHRYLKAGVGLLDVCGREFNQFDLFHSGQSVRSERMMKILDKTNVVHGRNALFLGSEGVVRKWVMRQQYKSPSYTTRWTDIPVVLMG
jgi:DNA polymerase V